MGSIIAFSSEGDFRKTTKFLEAIRERRIYKILDNYGQKGVDLLRASTPKRTGLTSESWGYNVVMNDGSVGLEWTNSNMANDGKTPIAILIQMGHGTRNGGYVPPTDYINPVMVPLFEEITEKIAEAVRSL